MVDFYVDRIERGKTTLDKVPASLREQVRDAYNAKHPETPLD